MSGNRRVWRGVAIASLAIIAIESITQPFGLLAVRANVRQLLDATWRDTLPEALGMTEEPGAPRFAEELRRCGGNARYEEVIAQTAEIDSSLRHMARQLYRGDIIEGLERRNPAWKLRLLVTCADMGLCSHRLDQDIPTWIEPADQDAALRFSERYVATRMEPLLCAFAKQPAR